jgi:hypothetical protein
MCGGLVVKGTSGLAFKPEPFFCGESMNTFKKQ